MLWTPGFGAGQQVQVDEETMANRAHFSSTHANSYCGDPERLGRGPAREGATGWNLRRNLLTAASVVGQPPMRGNEMSGGL